MAKPAAAGACDANATLHAPQPSPFSWRSRPRRPRRRARRSRRQSSIKARRSPSRRRPRRRESRFEPDLAEPANDRSAGGDEQPRSRSAIFLWQTDGAQHFTLVSPVLAATVGPATGTIVGRTWREIARTLPARSGWPGRRALCRRKDLERRDGRLAGRRRPRAHRRRAQRDSGVRPGPPLRRVSRLRHDPPRSAQRRRGGHSVRDKRRRDCRNGAAGEIAGGADAAVAAVPVPTSRRQRSPCRRSASRQPTSRRRPRSPRHRLPRRFRHASRSRPVPPSRSRRSAKKTSTPPRGRASSGAPSMPTQPDEPPTSEVGIDVPPEPAETKPIEPAARRATVPAVTPEPPPPTVAAAAETL